ncbi:MAG: hypothetical protein H6641_18395 [Caldilineaceae bacterium]|nr:hypothetical protein [Caldilineaceae bacterium]
MSNTTKTAPIYTNGSAPVIDIDQMIVGRKGEPMPTLFDELRALELEAEKLQLWALDHVDQLSEMNRADLGKFCAQLKQKGITSEWLRTELRPAVNDIKRTNAQGVTWTHYVEAAKRLNNEFRLNELDDSLEVNGQRMTDVKEAEILSRLHAEGLRNTDVARRAFLTEAGRNRYHPVKEYLESLHWDGNDHIGQLCEHFTDSHEPIMYTDGTERTALHAFHRRWFIGAIGKVYDSSECQNPMFILDGDQGRGKSYYVKWLCSPLPHLHFEGAIRPDDKDYLSYLTTRWIWEVGELGATMRRADREALKAFVTQQEATYRPSYGRYALHKPALASFIGTVNLEAGLLNDPTGHRRFWPVNVTSIDWGYSQAIDINQVWAQAYALYQQGESWRLSDEERKAHATITGQYEVEDPNESWIREYFDTDPEKNDWFMTSAQIASHLLTMGLPGSSARAIQLSLAPTMQRLKLQRKRQGGGGPWGYLGIRKRE